MAAPAAYACIKIEVTADYLARVRLELSKTLHLAKAPALARERENVEAIIGFIDRALVLLAELRRALCSDGSLPIAASILSELYTHTVTAKIPVPSHVRAALLDLYMSLSETIRHPVG